MLVVKSKIKENTENLNVSSDLAENLNNKVKALLRDACERCRANGRKTVQGRDL